MIKAWFEMKKKEIVAKNVFYSMFLEFSDEKKEIIVLVKKLYISLKDVPMNELRTEFIHQLATIIHTQSERERDNDITD